MKLNGNHSLAWWCYERLGADRLIGQHTLHGVDFELAPPEIWPRLKAHGAMNVLSLVTYPGGPAPFEIGFGNPQEQDRVIASTTALIDQTADAGFPSVIGFTGYGEPDETGRKACIEGLKRIAPHAEKRGVNICFEHLNTKVTTHPMKGHPGYMGHDFQWMLEIVKAVGSSRVTLLADAYHMQVMGGDLFNSYSAAIEYIGHVHVAGHPGRCALNRCQEINFPALAQHLQSIGYKGWIGQEWVPEDDRPEPLIIDDLEQSLKMMDVQ